MPFWLTGISRALADMDGPSNLKLGAPRAIPAKHEAEKLRKYRLPDSRAGANLSSWARMVRSAYRQPKS